MEIILTQQEALDCIEQWAILSQTKETLLPLLPKHKIFKLSRANYNEHIAPYPSTDLQVYLGVINGALINELVLIWAADFHPERSYVASRITVSEENIFLVDTIETRTTSYVELSSGLGILSNSSISDSNYLGSKNAIGSNEAYDKIKSWSEDADDWARISIDNDQGIVKAFSIPRSDVSGQFENETIDYINVLFGLYWSPITNTMVPDLILSGNRTRPDRVIHIIGPGSTINEVTDLIRPCPPFCDETDFFLL